MKMLILIASAVVLARSVTVAAPSAWAAHPASAVARADCPGKNPQTIIRSYYAAAVKGDRHGAEACLNVTLASRLASVPAPDWVTLRSLHITSMRQRTVTGKKRPPGTQTDAAMVEVTVKYIARYKHLVGGSNGPGTTYVYVAKATSRSPWRIDTIADRP